MGDIFDKLLSGSGGGDIFDRLTVASKASQNLGRIRAETPEERTFMGGLRDSVIPSREGLQEMARLTMSEGPIEQAKAAWRMGKGLVGAQWDQAMQAKDEYLQGNIREGLGHSVAAAVPVIGPAAKNAIEDIESGDIGYGLGQLTGIVGAAAIPGGKRASNAKKVASAPKRIAQAEADYAAIFGRKEAEMAARRAPEMMDRGIKFKNPKGDLAEMAEDRATAADSAIDQAIGNMKAPIDPAKVAARAEATRQGHMTPYGPDSQAISNKIDGYVNDVLPRNTVGDVATKTDIIEPATARELRQKFDKKPYGGSESSAPDVEARKAMGDALRGELNADPAVAAANAEANFWLNVKEIAKAAPEGKGISGVIVDNAKMAGAAIGAAGIGHALGAPMAAFLAGPHTLYAVYRTIRDIPRTPAWRSASAIRRRNFGKALQAGDYGKAAEIGAEIAGGSIIADGE